MKKTAIVVSAGIALAFAAILLSGIHVAFAWTNYDMDTDPPTVPGRYGTYVVSAVAGNKDAYGWFYYVQFWSASYWGDQGALPATNMYYTWLLDAHTYQSGEYAPGGIKTTGVSGTYDSAVVYTSRQFRYWMGTYWTYWWYSCSSAIS